MAKRDYPYSDLIADTKKKFCDSRCCKRQLSKWQSMKVHALNIASDSKARRTMIHEPLNGHLRIVCLFLYKYAINYYCFSAEDAQSSMAPDPTSNCFRGLCLLGPCFYFPFGLLISNTIATCHFKPKIYTCMCIYH